MCDTCGCDGKASVVSTGSMFGNDSINPLGASPISSTPSQMVEPEESMAHEMSEPRGPMGEDID